MKHIRLSIILAFISAFSFSLGAQAETKAVTDNLKDIFVELSKRLVPAVVNIYTTQIITTSPMMSPQMDMQRKFFERFFGLDEDFFPTQPQTRKAQSLGSGFIIDATEGLILTNYHVVAGADEIKIILTEDDLRSEGDPETKGIDGKVVGADQEVDVALIKIKTKQKLTAAPLGDSDATQVGEWVMAIGNPFGHGHTVTHGIVSAKERSIAPISRYANFIQTDAPINPGNSGGPLINTAGEVIGVNTAINAAAQGIGFATPINLVKKILPDLRSKGSVTRGFIGVTLGPSLNHAIAKKLGLKEDTTGIMIASVIEGEAASKAGLLANDIVTDVNGKKVGSVRDFANGISSLAPGTKVVLGILRKGKRHEISLVVGKSPSRKDLLGKAPSKPMHERIKTGMELSELDEQIRRELRLPKQVHGVIVQGVAEGSPAEEAGLSRGDVIVEVDQTPIANLEAFYSIVNKKELYIIRFMREGDYFITSLDLKKE